MACYCSNEARGLQGSTFGMLFQTLQRPIRGCSLRFRCLSARLSSTNPAWPWPAINGPVPARARTIKSWATLPIGLVHVRASDNRDMLGKELTRVASAGFLGSLLPLFCPRSHLDHSRDPSSPPFQRNSGSVWTAFLTTYSNAGSPRWRTNVVEFPIRETAAVYQLWDLRLVVTSVLRYAWSD